MELSGENLLLGTGVNPSTERSLHFRNVVDSTGNPHFYADWKGWIDESLDLSHLYHKLFVPTDGAESFTDSYPQASALLENEASKFKLDCGGGAVDISKSFSENSNKYWWFKLQMGTENGAEQMLHILTAEVGDLENWSTFDLLSCTQASWSEIKGYRVGRIPAYVAEVNVHLDQYRVSSAPLWPPFVEPTPTTAPTPTPTSPVAPTPAPPVYQNSFEAAGCANEKGSNPAVSVAVQGDANCDYTGDGVVDRTQAMRVGAEDWLTLSGAIDTTGRPNLYTQLSMKVRNTTGGTSSAEVLIPGGWGGYPRLRMNTTLSTRRVTLVCDASTSAFVPLDANVQYTVQTDAKLDSAGIQNMRVYRNDTQALVGSAQCLTAAAQPAYSDFIIGYTTPWDNGADVVLDNLLASYYPLGDPFGASFPTPSPTALPSVTPTPTATPTPTPTPTALPTPPPTGGPVVSLVASLTSGPSPLAVGFDATGTTAEGYSAPFSDLLYKWDYGDTASGTWALTGKNRNKMTGPIGAHVFEPTTFDDICDTNKPCKRFTVNLTVTSPANLNGYASQVITVYSPNATGANGWGDAGETICISKVSDWYGCPSVSTHVTSSSNVETLLNTHVNSNRRILFHAGETWTMNATKDFSSAHDGPSMIGSYGTANGGKFTINHTGSYSWPGRFWIKGDNWRYQDFDNVALTTGHVLFGGSGEHVPMLNVLIQRTSTSANGFSNTAMLDPLFLAVGDSPHQNLFFVDNVWRTLTASSSGYVLYAGGVGIYALGNTIGEAPVQHSVRIVNGLRLLVSNNRIGPGAWGRSTINLRDTPSACSDCGSSPYKPLCGVPTQYYLVQDNQMVCRWPSCIGTGLRSCGDQTNPPAPEIPEYDYIFERNLFTPHTSGSGGNAINAELVHGAKYRWVHRNNIVNFTGWNIAAESHGLVAPTGVSAFNNTCFTSSSGTNAIGCIRPGTATECRNNILYAPSWSGTKSWKNGTGTCTSTSHNFDNGVTGNITYLPFVDSTPTDPVDFTPASPSQILNAGTDVPSVFDDAVGNCRTGTFDAGALERGAVPCQ
jgi:hypothetical protein